VPLKKIGLGYKNYSSINVLNFFYKNPEIQISLSLWNLRSSDHCS